MLTVDVPSRPLDGWNMGDPLQWASCRNRPYRLPSTWLEAAYADEENMVVGEFRRRGGAVASPGLRAEQRVLEWFARLHFHRPETVRGDFVGGSSEAVLLALWRLRRYAARQGRRLLVLGTAGTHYSVDRACGILSVEYRALAADGLGRHSVPAVESTLADLDSACVLPVVVLTLGLSLTGQCDDLQAMADVRVRHPGMRLHVDGAMGGLSARFLRPTLPLLDECGVDSVSCDLHKSGLCCFGSGILLTRNELFEASAFPVPALRGCQDFSVGGSRSSIPPVLAAEVVGRMEGRWRPMFLRQRGLRDRAREALTGLPGLQVVSCPEEVPMLTLEVTSPALRERIVGILGTPFFALPGAEDGGRRFCRVFFNRQNRRHLVDQALRKIREGL